MVIGMPETNQGGRPRKPHVHLHVRLNKALAATLRSVAADLGSTLTDCVEQAVTEWLARQLHGKKRK